jgi:hypothetical protein
VSVAGTQNVVFTVSITDADGDTATDTHTITITDGQGPGDGNAVALDVDEDDLPAGSDTSKESLTDTDTVTFSPVGSDGIASYALLGSDATITVNVNGVVGQDLFWTNDAGVLNAHLGSAAGTVVLTVSLVSPNLGAGTVQVSAELKGALPHVNATGENTITITGITVQASDVDGDTATAAVTVNVVDDVPTPADPEYAMLVNGAGPLVSGLDLDPDSSLSNNLGADGGTVRFSPSLEGSDSGLTSHGVPIIYDVSPDGLTLTGNASGSPVFVITLNPGTATYSIDMEDIVDSRTQVNFSDGAFNFVGGNNEWAGFIPDGETVAVPIDNDSRDLLLTPEINGVHDGSINTTANSGGVGSGASVGTGETFRVDFVTDLRGDPQSTGGGDYDTLSKRDHVFDGHYLVNGSTAVFTATGGTTVNIAAFDDLDGNTQVGDAAAPDPITGVAINYNGQQLFIDLNAPLSPSYVIGGRTFTIVENVNGSINVGGVFGDSTTSTQIAVFTATSYNSLEYTYVSGDPFKIGNFGAAVPTNDPVSFSVPIEVVDGDGDVAASSIGITLTPTGESIHDYSTSLVPVTATAGAGGNPEQHIIGSDLGDTLTGNANANALSGGEGNDLLTGAGGNDILAGGPGADTLIGGQGNDLLTGGSGNDLFKWGLGDAGSTTATDIVADFGTGDVLNLDDMLTTPDHTGATLDNYLHISYDSTEDRTVVEVSLTGSFTTTTTTGPVGGSDQLIYINGQNLVGSFTTQETLINDLISSGKLVA